MIERGGELISAVGLGGNGFRYVYVYRRFSIW